MDDIPLDTLGLALAEKALRDDGRQRRRARRDQGVAEQDHAEEGVGPAEKRERQLGAATAARSTVLQPVAVDSHHRRFRDREEAGREQQHADRDRERFRGNLVHCVVMFSVRLASI